MFDQDQLRRRLLSGTVGIDGVVQNPRIEGCCRGMHRCVPIDAEPIFMR